MHNVLQIGFPGSEIRCLVRSDTESARVRKIKETWTAEWARGLPPGSIFYDIGANVGIMSLLAVEDREKGVRGLAFEPALTNFPSLVENIRLNDLESRLYPFAFGIGEKTGFVNFNYQNITLGGALHSFGDIIPIKATRSTVPVLSVPTLCYSLDDFVKISDVPFPTHVKIDVDGMEIQILRGGSDVLSDERVEEVQVESVDFSEDQLTSAAIKDCMLRYGFRHFDEFFHNSIYPLARDFRFRRSGRNQ